MKKRIGFLFTFFMGCLVHVLAQSKVDPPAPTPDSVLNRKIRLQTEVFVLDTREPTQLSLVRMYDDNRFVKKMNLRRLSVNGNRFSAFKITSINPLRYKYYINNQLVTQFFDAGNLNPGSNTFSNGAYLPVQDISTIKIFNLSGGSTAQVKQLQDIRAAIGAGRLSLKKEEAAIRKTYRELRYARDSVVYAKELKLSKKEIDVKKTRLNTLNEKYGALSDAYEDDRNQLEEKISNFEALIQTMNINNGSEEVIDEIISTYNDSTRDFGTLTNDMHPITRILVDQCWQYKNNIWNSEMVTQNLQPINDYANSAERYGAMNQPGSAPHSIQLPQTSLRTDFDELLDNLKKIKYESYYINDIKTNNYFIDTLKFQLEALSIKEYIVNRKFELLQTLTLTTCVEVGSCCKKNMPTTHGI